MHIAKPELSKYCYTPYIAAILFSFFIFNLSAASQTSAVTYQSTAAPEFTLDPAISITISGDLTIDQLAPGDGSDSNIITVTASSNSAAGYSLTSTVGNNTHTDPSYNNTYLNHPTNSNYKFNSISTNKSSIANFDDNTWGYSWCNGNSENCTTSSNNWVSGDLGSTASGYNGLPLYSATGIKLVDANTSGSATISFKIGAKASATQASGTYTNVVNFIGVANPSTSP